MLGRLPQRKGSSVSEVGKSVGQTTSEKAGLAGDLDVRIAQELIERARAEGVLLVGEGGLLRQVTRTVLQTALEAELSEHLGYERGEAPPAGGGNHRNGSSAKTVRTEVGDVRLLVPRDRRGSFEPRIVPKHARRVAGFDEAIISLYAKGLTTDEIQAHLAEIYDVQVSRDLVSRVTDKVAEELAAWQSRPLDAGRFLVNVANPDMKGSQCRVGHGTRRRPTPSAATLSSSAAVPVARPHHSR